VTSGLKTVSFPSISTGAYGYPVDSAAEVALQTVVKFLEKKTPLQEVVFVLFDNRTCEVYIEELERLLSRST